MAEKKVIAKELSPDFEIPSRRYDSIRLTVASLRLDVIVASLIHVSRDQACRLINGKTVAVNHITIEKKTKEINAGDCLIIRGCGKWIIDACDEQTRKGRIIIKCRKYI